VLRAQVFNASRKLMMQTLVAFVLASLSLDAAAHDLITAESAQAYLAAVAESQKTIASKEPAAKRARAQLDLGKTLDEIRELLNRDLAAHGRVQGLPSNFLMSELEARGAELAFAPETNRFLANVQHYREALKLEPSGLLAADAAFRLLQGYFYDSFTSDPLQPGAQTRAQLAEQIILGEGLLKMHPQHGEREGGLFHPRDSLHAGGALRQRRAGAGCICEQGTRACRGIPQELPGEHTCRHLVAPAGKPAGRQVRGYYRPLKGM